MPALSLTWADLLTNSLKRINVIGQGGSMTANDGADAFTQLQMWIDALAIRRLSIPYILRTTWTISSTKGTLASPYTVGTGGDISVTKPTFIERIRYQDTSVSPTLEYPLIMLTDAAWEAITQKNLTSTLPSMAYYNPTWQDGVTNLGSLYLWMVPTSTTLQGVLYAPAQVPTPVNLTDTIVLPNGYQWAIQENLAVLFASTFRENLPPDPMLVRSAKEAMDWIETQNVRMVDLALDRAVLARRGGYYNINSDTWR